jgi:uncharacterized membrane protein YesL
MPPAQKKLNGIVGGSYNLGLFILGLIKLHFFWLFLVFRYAIILGIFPVTKAIIEFYFQQFKNKDKAPSLRYDYFNKLVKKDFSIANILGWTETIIYLFLVLDIYINQHLLNNILIQIILVILLIIVSGTILFQMPVLIRYQLTTKQYFQQAFFMFLASPLETLAIIAGIFMVCLLSALLPILIIICAIPLFLLPIAWFSFQAINKREKQLKQMN